MVAINYLLLLTGTPHEYKKRPSSLEIEMTTNKEEEKTLCHLPSITKLPF